MRRITVFEQIDTSGGHGHAHGQPGNGDPQQDPEQTPALPPAPAGRVAAAVSRTAVGWCRPLLAADRTTGFFCAARREPACPGLPRLTWARPLIARGSPWPGPARRPVPVGLTARRAVTAELAVAAGSAARPSVPRPPASGTPPPGTAASRAADTGTTACGTTGRGTGGTGTGGTGSARTGAIGSGTTGSGTTRPGPRVGLPGTRGVGRGRRERVRTRCLPGAEARTARIGLRAASGT